VLAIDMLAIISWKLPILEVIVDEARAIAAFGVNKDWLLFK